MANSTEKALGLLRNLPRVALGNLKPLPGYKSRARVNRGQHGGRKCGRGNKGQGQRDTLPRIGFEGNNTPFYLIVPKEPYYKGHHVKRQHPPFSLLHLQRLIDTGRVDTSKPIDLTTLCNTGALTVKPQFYHYGVDLIDEGADIFDAKINIEVQRASELTIAAIEKNGGTITNKFYDLQSVTAMIDPLAFFKQGVPIPRCKLPSQDALGYYTSGKNRGYLADPDELWDDRFVLAQKYGYKLPDISADPEYEMLMRRKDPRQIWFGLEPGWVINMKDKCILKPVDQEYVDYFKS